MQYKNQKFSPKPFVFSSRKINSFLPGQVAFAWLCAHMRNRQAASELSPQQCKLTYIALHTHTKPIYCVGWCALHYYFSSCCCCLDVCCRKFPQRSKYIILPVTYLLNWNRIISCIFPLTWIANVLKAWRCATKLVLNVPRERGCGTAAAISHGAEHIRVTS